MGVKVIIVMLWLGHVRYGREIEKASEYEFYKIYLFLIQKFFVLNNVSMPIASAEGASDGHSLSLWY